MDDRMEIKHLLSEIMDKVLYELPVESPLRIGKRKFRGNLNRLAAEIIDEILHKLPVKSLLRFKCVSKSWRSSISSKRFAREHLNKSNSSTDFSHHHLLFPSYQSNRLISGSDFLPLERLIKLKSAGSCCIGSLLSDVNDDYEPVPNYLVSNQPIPIPAVEDSRGICLLGSCNGLILIWVNMKELYLWNPSIRKAKNILINAPFPKETGNASFSGCGFGYNELTDDYKVVCPLYDYTRPGYEMFMYSSRTGSWKTILNFDKPFLLNGPAKFVNGGLHWLTQEEDEEVDEFGIRLTWNIVSLDLLEEDEKYRIMAPPPHCGFSHYGEAVPVLAELGGYLSFISYDHINQNQKTMDVWVMKKESWSKIWTFSDQVGGGLPKPIWLKKNGDLVGLTGSDLVVYRGKDKLRQSGVYIMVYSEFESIVYVESLVAPISDGKELRR